MSIPANRPKIEYNTTQYIWLPRSFLSKSWKAKETKNREITKGYTYIQTVTMSAMRNEIKGEIAPFYGLATSGTDFEDWDGAGAGDFYDAWYTFWNTWASLGKPFTFYRDHSKGAVDLNYWQYCVWAKDDSGIEEHAGFGKHTLNIDIITEPVSR